MLISTLEEQKKKNQGVQIQATNDRMELEQTKSQLEERTCVFYTLSSAVRTEKERLLDLNNRLECLQKEYTELYSNVQNGRKDMKELQSHLSDVYNVSKPRSSVRPVGHQNFIRNRKVENIHSVSCTNREKCSNVRKCDIKSKGKEVKKPANDFVDIFGGRIHK